MLVVQNTERSGKMNAILNRIKKDDTGAATVIEMTLIFPLVLCCVGFLLYIGSYVMQSVMIYNDAQRIAVAACREIAMPGYEKLYDSTGITTKADFNWADGVTPDKDKINAFMREHKPYRYWGNGALSESRKTDLESNLKRLIASNSFLAPSSVECDVLPDNELLNYKVKVHVVKHISTPQLFQSLGVNQSMDIDVTATAVVCDTTDFIRNTDMVFDLADFLMGSVPIDSGGNTINDKIAMFKQKFTDAKAKLGITS